MPRVTIILYKHQGGTKVALLADQASAGQPADANALTITANGATETLTIAGSPIRIGPEFLDPDPNDADTYRLKQDGSLELILRAEFVFDADPSFFQRKFQPNVGGVVTLELHIPVLNQASPRPYLVVCCRGHVDVGSGGLFAVAEVGYCVVIDKLPAFDTPELPSLSFHPPGELPWPDLRIPWPSFPTLPALHGLRLPSFAFDLPGVPLRVGCESIDFSIPSGGDIGIRLSGFRIEGVGGNLNGRLEFNFKLSGQSVDVTLNIQFDQLPGINGVTLHTFGDGCFGVDWQGTAADPLLKLFGHDLSDDTAPSGNQFKLRVHGSNEGVDEIRLDWSMGSDREFKLPGIVAKVISPDTVSLLFRRTTSVQDSGEDDRATRLTLIATFETGKAIHAWTTFGWPLDTEQRESHRDGEGKNSEKLIEFSAAASDRLSVAIFDFPLSKPSDAPRYFKALETPLSPLDLQETTAGVEFDVDTIADTFEFAKGLVNACPTTPVKLRSLTLNDITASLKFNSAFVMPFLNRLSELFGDQAIKITKISQPVFEPHPTDHRLLAKMTATVEIKIGGIVLNSDIDLKFDLERMAFDVDFERGINFVLPADSGNKPHDFLGLKWTFRGTPEKVVLVDDPDPAKRWELPKGTAFLLTIKDRDYKLRQAPGAEFELAYDKATMEGDAIVFRIRDFALTPNGIDLNAEITDKPARLNGLETQFKFTEGALQIRENRVAGFTIAGTGPLPPDLVGDAVADIALQFGQEGDGSVRLIRGAAKIRGPKLLSCTSTRFDFELDGLGLNFVHDGGGDHLYFTITGKARYRLQGGDDTSGALAWLPGIEIQLVDCPLTGNARVIAKHVRFLIELPKKVKFSFLGCFTMELRAIGFVPQFDKFGDDTAAMQLSGQIMFADTGDAIETKIDLHDLYVARPEKGKFLPRLYLRRLGVRIAQGDSFALEAVVDFFNGEEVEPGIKAHGFIGEGSVAIKGLPPIAASTAWLRVSNDAGATWRRAWFLYLEARQLSLRIPVVEIYIREIGFGFGYRYTLASIKEADETVDVRKLLKRLKQLSRTQGNLSRRDQWRIDLENPGEDPRWTIAMRALFSATSAQTAPFTGYDVTKEKDLPCLYVMDAVLAVRSDLTFFLAGRAWLNTNYNDFHAKPGLKDKPLLSGFALLSPRQKRFLANLSSNPEADFGDHPPLPEFLKAAIRQSQFTATLLIEPGLLHYELGWPNQLRWQAKLGPLEAQFCGGTIFRVSRTELVVGNSFLARGRLELKAEVSAGFFGAGLYALADVAYGARYIGVLAFDDPAANSALYGAVGLDIRVQVDIQFWLRIKIGFIKISIKLGLSFHLQFTAALQVGIALPNVAGALGTATLSLQVMGRRLNFNVRVGLNEDTVTVARARTEKFLHIGLEAEEVEPVPGTDNRPSIAALNPVPVHANALAAANVPLNIGAPVGGTNPAAPLTSGTFHAPDYFVGQAESKNELATRYLLLLPRGPANSLEKDGFLAVPPAGKVSDGSAVIPASDFKWSIPKPTVASVSFQQWDRTNSEFEIRDLDNAIEWTMAWDDEVSAEEQNGQDGVRGTLREFLRYAYVYSPADADFGAITPTDDPATHWVPDDTKSPLEDHRVQNPTDNAFEAAVRGAAEQFAAPYFKFDPNSPYDSNLRDAFDKTTDVYERDGKGKGNGAPSADQAAVELRSSLIQAITRDFHRYVELSGRTDNESKNERVGLEKESLAFRLGLIFKVTGGNPEERNWLENPSTPMKINQRTKVDATTPDSSDHDVTVFNPAKSWFETRSPQFAKVRTYVHANTVAIDWRLQFPDDGSLSGFQGIPEHHLRHYVVRREHLDGNDPKVEFTLKHGEVLHRSSEDVIRRLLPRFQLVDHFPQEEAGEVAPLTAAGKTYLYTITAIDIAGTPGSQPLSLVVTRYPADPPLVPTDGELVVHYPIWERVFDKNNHHAAEIPLPEQNGAEGRRPLIRQLESGAVTFRFSDPFEPSGRPPVPVRKYWLVFRRESTLPVGFFGADEDARGGKNRGLGVSNARRLRTDLAIPFSDSDIKDAPLDQRAESGRRIRIITVPIAELQSRGILPPADSQGNRDWRPEGWRVFLQTESEASEERSGVLSVLAPASIRFRFERVPIAQQGTPQFEDRQFGRLEWLPNPVRLDLLPPHDTAGDVGFAKVPMPNLGSPDTWALDLGQSVNPKTIDGLAFEQHPARMRAAKLVWNQGPSPRQTDKFLHPLDLHARYQVYEFDAFSTPGEKLDIPSGTPTIDFRRWSDDANLRKIQEVDLLPAEDMAKVPAEAGDPLIWEAWYPGTSRRLIVKRQQIKSKDWPATTDAILGPWYSWRDSHLVWPNPLGLVEDDPNRPGEVIRLRSFHPFLEDVAAVIGRTRVADIFPDYFAEAGPLPARGGDNARDNVTESNPGPKKPGVLDGLLKGTAPSADPYGWGILQRMGLAMGLRVRVRANDFSSNPPVLAGDYLTGDRLFNLVRNAIKSQESRKKLTITRRDAQQPAPIALTVNENHPISFRLSPDDRGPVTELPGKQNNTVTHTINPTWPEDNKLILTVWDGEPVVTPHTNITITPYEAAAFNPTPFLHVEYLFQPGKRIRIANKESESIADVPHADTLALLQLSLRPAVQQKLRYVRRTFFGMNPGSNVQFELDPISSDNLASYLVEIGTPGVPEPLSEKRKTTITIPPNGELTFLVRAIEPEKVTISSEKILNRFVKGSEGEELDVKAVSTLAGPTFRVVGIGFETLEQNKPKIFRVRVKDGVVRYAVQGNVNNVAVTVTRVKDGSPVTPQTPAEIPFSPTDWKSAFFSSPPEAPWIGNQTINKESRQRWQWFVRLLRGVEPLLSADELDPQTEPGKAKRPELLSWLDRFFGTGGDVIPNIGDTLAGTTANKVWIASGYPRTSTPLPLAPDSAGRITYYRPIEDLWAHAFRYYVRPRGRYELLWEELGRSKALIRDESVGIVEDWQKELSSPEPGGADVSLGRIRPLAAPLVLSSRRVDKATAPNNVPSPGPTWEVLLAKHPEQDLVEKNRSLVNHLEYRHSAQALFRTLDSSDVKLPDLQKVFARATSRLYPALTSEISPQVQKLFLYYGSASPEEIDLTGGNSLTATANAINATSNTTHISAATRTIGVGAQLLLSPTDPNTINASLALLVTQGDFRTNLVTFPLDLSKIEWPTWENAKGIRRPKLPAVPNKPDDLDFTKQGNTYALSDEDAATLDLPLRTTQFTRGAMAVQYQALPFYYTHKLLLIAQAASVVSPITTVVHKDFEYISPKSQSLMEGVAAPDGSRYRRIGIPLARLWDGLPASAQQEWPIENPVFVSDPLKLRRPASLTDAESCYAIVIERPASGNVEVIAEYRFKPDEPAGYESRRLEGPFRGEAMRLRTMPNTSPEATQDRVELETVLFPSKTVTPVTEIQRAAVSTKIAFDAAPNWLVRWPRSNDVYPRVAVWRTHARPTGDGSPDELSPQELKAIQLMLFNVDAALGNALQSLLGQTGAARYAEACVSFDQLKEIHDAVTIEPVYVPGVRAPVGSGKVTWTGYLTKEQKVVIQEWIKTSLFQGTFANLVTALTDRIDKSNEYPAGAVTQLDLQNAGLNARVSIQTGTTNKELLAWSESLTKPPTPAELTGLQQLIAAVSDNDAKAAIGDLANRIALLEDTKTEVSVAETFWQPRPTQDSFKHPTLPNGDPNPLFDLKNRLLVGNGVIAFAGLMTLDEGKSLRDGLGLTEPDQDSVVQLFMSAANTGLSGGQLQLVVRRGAAAPSTQPIEGQLKIKD